MEAQSMTSSQFFTEKEKEQFHENCIRQVVEEHHKRTGKGIDGDTLCAAAQLLAEVKLDSSLLELIYSGKILASFNEEIDDIEFRPASAELSGGAHEK